MPAGRLARPCLACRSLASNTLHRTKDFSSLQRSQQQHDRPVNRAIGNYQRTHPGRENNRPFRRSGATSRSPDFPGVKSWPQDGNGGQDTLGNHESEGFDAPIFRSVPFPDTDAASRSSGDGLRSRPRREERRTNDHMNIPFDIGVAAAKTMPVEGTSITPREKQVFAKLLQLQSASPGQDVSSHNDVARDPIVPDEGIDPARVANDALVEAELARVRKAFEEAETDMHLCKILMQAVLARAVDLGLDRSEASEARNAVLASLEGLKRKDETEPCDAQIFSQAFPQHLVNFMHVIASKFPASTMWNVLPVIQALGPATFALGGSTALYNAHILMIWLKYQDRPRVIEMLEEMDRNVYLYDGGTQRLVLHILEELSHQRGGHYGDAVREMYRPTAAQYETLVGIKHRIMAQRQDEALRAARAQYVDPGAAYVQGEELDRV